MKLKPWTLIIFVTGCILITSVQAAPTDTHNEAIINAPQAEVWKALTTREGVESWMVARADIDLRIGGLMRTHYQKEGAIGDDGTIASQIISLDAPRMYSTRIAKPQKGFPFMTAWKSVWTVVYLDALAADKTKVTIRMLGYNDDAESQKMRDFFQFGNQYTIDELVAKFRPVTPKLK